MKIACIYTVETYDSIEKPLSAATEIPFGIATIYTALEQAEYNVELFIITPDTPLDEYLKDYILDEHPKLFCFTAVSTQYWQVKHVAKYIKSVDSSIFCLLGGHEASMNSQKVIEQGVFDAICVSEGEKAVVEIAKSLDNGFINNNINNLWFYDRVNGEIKKNLNSPFTQNLDDIPLFNRRVWDNWVRRPDDYPAILLGRGCPFKCTYCANHAMQKLADGKFVRFRSPENIIKELDYLVEEYPNMERVYMEVETFGANRKASLKIFEALAEYNQQRSEPLKFGINLALTSGFMKNTERIHETLRKIKAANLLTINIGLESGSQSFRKNVLIRPPYTNNELIEFCRLAREEYGLKIVFFVLLGLPGETLADYRETVRVSRESQPHNAYVSIFFPYLGTDLATIAINMDLIDPDNLTPEAERSQAILSLPGFTSKRIRFEYIIFWWRVYRGYWPYLKIFAHIARSFLQAYPKMYSLYLYLRNNIEFIMKLSNKFGFTGQNYKLRKVSKTVGTRVDVMTE